MTPSRAMTTPRRPNASVQISDKSCELDRANAVVVRTVVVLQRDALRDRGMHNGQGAIPDTYQSGRDHGQGKYFSWKDNVEPMTSCSYDKERRGGEQRGWAAAKKEEG